MRAHTGISLIQHVSDRRCPVVPAARGHPRRHRSFAHLLGLTLVIQASVPHKPVSEWHSIFPLLPLCLLPAVRIAVSACMPISIGQNAKDTACRPKIMRKPYRGNSRNIPEAACLPGASSPFAHGLSPRQAAPLLPPSINFLSHHHSCSAAWPFWPLLPSPSLLHAVRNRDSFPAMPLLGRLVMLSISVCCPTTGNAFLAASECPAR